MDDPLFAMARNLPSHELRERWLTAISASLHQVTVFRFARKRALQLVDLISDLKEELLGLKQTLRDYLPNAQLLKFWQGVHHILKALDAGYFNILQRLANSEWVWWRHKDKTQRSQLHAKKESMIKHLVVYDWLLSLIQNAFELSFQGRRPWFLDSWKQSQKAGYQRTQRRFSHHDRNNCTTSQTRERVVIELSMLRWTKFLEKQLLESIVGMQNHYNSGKCFEHYVRHLQWADEEEKADWQSDGVKWPYPEIILKLGPPNTFEARFNQRHGPTNGVLTWQEDEELQTFFS